MNNLVKVDLTIDVTDYTQVKRLNDLLEAMGAMNTEEKARGKVSVSESLKRNDPSGADYENHLEAVKEETPVKKTASRSKKNTSTTSEAFEDKERTESVADEYLAAKEVEVEEPEIVETQSTVTLDALRARVTPELLDKHRKALKDKIVEFGGQKLVDLPVSKYSDFNKFLDTLK